MITDIRGGSRDFEKGGALCQLKKKILGFRWSKKAKITETKAFGEAFPSIFSNFQVCRWNFISFLRFTNAFKRKEKKQSYNSQWEKKNWE